MFLGFNRTRTCHDNNFRPSDFHSANIKYRSFALECTAGEFERFGNAHNFRDAIQQFDLPVVELRVNADGAQNCMLHTCGAMDIKSVVVQNADDFFNLLFGGTCF